MISIGVNLSPHQILEAEAALQKIGKIRLLCGLWALCGERL
jgi:hypothetical protein